MVAIRLGHCVSDPAFRGPAKLRSGEGPAVHRPSGLGHGEAECQIRRPYLSIVLNRYTKKSAHKSYPMKVWMHMSKAVMVAANQILGPMLCLMTNTVTVRGGTLSRTHATQ